MYAGSGAAGDYAGDPRILVSGRKSFATSSEVRVAFNAATPTVENTADLFYYYRNGVRNTNVVTYANFIATVNLVPTDTHIMDYWMVIEVPDVPGALYSATTTGDPLGAAVDAEPTDVNNMVFGYIGHVLKGHAQLLNSTTGNKVRGSYTQEPTYAGFKVRGSYAIPQFNYQLAVRGSYATINTFPSMVRGQAHILNSLTGLKVCGSYRIVLTVASSCKSFYRLANEAVSGWAVWIGVGAQPDLDLAPNLIAQSLPFSIPITPPVSGTEDYYVVVRKANQYNLRSVNQNHKILTIDEFGDLVRAVVSEPQNLMIYPQVAGAILVGAQYVSTPTPDDPPDSWYVWITAAPAVIGVDTPLASFTVSTGFRTIYPGPYAPGTWHVTVALYRAVDGEFSEPLRGVVVVPAAPAMPGNVHSVDELE